MPELPEVETIVRGLAKRITGDVIESVWIGTKPEPLLSPAAEIAKLLEKARIARVHRAGKHILLDLADDSPPGAKPSSKKKKKKPSRSAPQSLRGTWVVHLGMTGRLLISRPEMPQHKHTHLVAKLASGRELRFVDPRRFGRLFVQHNFQAASLARASMKGVEPLEVRFEDFTRLFKPRHTPIKNALLNQSLLRGIGNIYADESLFRAGIRPLRRAARLTREQLQRLHRAIQRVLLEAIAAGGSSISDYVDAAGEEGFFQLRHRVYGREDQPCLRCKTPIRRIVLSGRSSHYCPQCQK
jgi:formamidopyrimidine-DNA glycosylase